MFTEEIRSLIGKKKSLKRLLKSTGIDNDRSAKDNINLKVKRLEHKIDKAIADYNNSFVMSMVNQHGGSLDKQSFWKVKRVLAPKSITVPHSVINGFGNEYKNEFKHRLRTRDIDEQLKEVETMQNHLCQLRLLKSRTEVSPDFSMEEFDKVIGELKSGKSTDPTGLIREVFKNGGST